jgi:hypothetical protein
VIEMSAEVHARGNAVNGRANMLIRRYESDLETEVAQFGYDLIQFLMRSHFRRPRPWYWHQVKIEHTGDPRITDGGVVYGPWLEGTGSRNASSRFKGYRHWRQTQNAMDANAERIGDELWRRTMARHF